MGDGDPIEMHVLDIQEPTVDTLNVAESQNSNAPPLKVCLAFRLQVATTAKYTPAYFWTRGYLCF